MQFSIIAKVINKHHTLSAEDCVSEPVWIKKKKKKKDKIAIVVAALLL